ncbi:myeloid differentiation primary response 88-like, partial [Paramuricea clavata]
SENYSQSPAVGKLPIELEQLTVSDEIFDGFICYAKEDRSFALEILTRLEAPPYCRKICIDFRDYVPGNCRLDQTAKIIEHRCKHLVAILSPNFTNSSNAGFQVRIALNLSPDFDQRRVIPILYENCDIPEILKPIYHLNYGDSSEHPYFWKKLAVALGYSEPYRLRGSPRGSPHTDKKYKQIVEKKESPATKKKSRGGLFNIIKKDSRK